MTKKLVPKETKKNEKIIYIGPSLSEGRLSYATIYIDGLPDYIKAIIEKHPWFRQLFVPIRKMNDAMAATKIKGNVLHTLYQRAQKEV